LTLNLLKFDVTKIKQSVISVAFKTPLKARLEICIDKTSHQHIPDEYIGFTPSCPPTFCNKIAPMVIVSIFRRPESDLHGHFVWQLTVQLA